MKKCTTTTKQLQNQLKLNNNTITGRISITQQQQQKQQTSITQQQQQQQKQKQQTSITQQQQQQQKQHLHTATAFTYSNSIYRQQQHLHTETTTTITYEQQLQSYSTRKAKVSSTAKRAAEVTSASDGAIAVQAKSKKTPRPTEDDDDVYTTESTDVSDVEVKEKEPKKSKTNSIETKTIDALKNAATSVIFMNLFTIHCTQNGVDPTLKTIMDNGAASNELLQLLQPTHNESVKNNDKIEGETLKKLIHRNFRSKTLVPVKTDYEAANIKVVDAISNRNCYSAQDVIKNIEAIMSYNNVINPVYLIHGTHEVQLEYLRSILDSNILALLKMVVPDWLQTDVAIKLNTQTDITECREAITELVLNNADKFSRRRPSNSASNAGEKSPMKKDHAVPNHNSHSRNHHDAQAEKIRADTLPKLQKGSKVDLQKVRSSFIVYRESKGHCLNCGKSNHKVDTCGVGPVDTRVYPVGQSAKKQQ
ncbi:hypothetical protein ACTFIW_010060 [Dictyostelium discoideum]